MSASLGLLKSKERGKVLFLAVFLKLRTLLLPCIKLYYIYEINGPLLFNQWNKSTEQRSGISEHHDLTTTISKQIG